MVNHNRNTFHYAIISKVFPLILLIPLFLVTSVWTRDGAAAWLSAVNLQLDVATVFYTGILTYTGIMYVIETIYALPETGKSSAGTFGAVLLGGIAIGTFVFAGAIFVGAYEPQEDSSTFNVVLSLIMLGAIIMFFMQGREEIFHFRRYSTHRVFNR